MGVFDSPPNIKRNLSDCLISVIPPCFFVTQKLGMEGKTDIQRCDK